MSIGKEKQINRIENTTTYMNMVSLGNLGKLTLPRSFRQIIKLFTFLTVPLYLEFFRVHLPWMTRRSFDEDFSIKRPDFFDLSISTFLQWAKLQNIPKL